MITFDVLGPALDAGPTWAEVAATTPIYYQLYRELSEDTRRSLDPRLWLSEWAHDRGM